MGTTHCAATPGPHAPEARGSVGLPHAGVLVGGAKLPAAGSGYARLRDDERAWGTPALVQSLRKASERFHRVAPGPPLVIADLSAEGGGKISHHRSHRTGRDADLLLLLQTVQGAPVKSPGFVPIGRDGIGEFDGKLFALDVHRQWVLIRSLVTESNPPVQWLFVARWLQRMVIDHALSIGEDPELAWQIEALLQQPGDSAPHGDHIHLRQMCAADEMCTGGPTWPWLTAARASKVPLTVSDTVLAQWLGLHEAREGMWRDAEASLR